MKTPHHPTRQRGLVLVLALIVLAAMSVAAVGLMRGVFSSNRVAGNLAYQQAAVQAADVGMERAIAWLEQQARETIPAPGGASGAAPVPSNRLYNHVVASATHYHYSATRAEPGVGQTWENFWQSLVDGNLVNDLPADATGNSVSFAIHRLCSATGDPAGANCEASPDARSGQGGSKSNGRSISAPSPVYYRVTVRVQGPRNATSFIQAVVSI